MSRALLFESPNKKNDTLGFLYWKNLSIILILEEYGICLYKGILLLEF